MKKWIWMSN